MSDLESLMLYAVHENNLSKLRELILDISLNSTQGHGYVLLRDSVKQSNVEMTRLLLAKGANTNSKTSKIKPTSTPLHFAAKNGNLEIVEMLLDYEADINSKDGCGSTPLEIAIKNERENIALCLLKRRALLLSDKRNLVYAAVNIGSYNITEKVLFYGANVNYQHPHNSYTPLHIACGSYCPNISIIELLLKNGAAINSITTDGLTPLHLNITNAEENVEVVDLLLKYGAEINFRTRESFTPLYLAIKNSKTNVANFLIDKGAKTDEEFSNGKTILSFAIERNLSMVVEKILTHSPNIENKINRQSFKTALKQTYRDSKTIRILLKYGFSIEPEDVNDFELLHTSIKQGDIQIIEQFLEHGLDLTSNNENVKKLLHIAQKGKQVKVAKLLLEHGADVNAKDVSGNTPLFYAVKDSDADMTECLIQHGADVQNNPKLILVAAENLCNRVIKILLENKIDTEKTDNSGRTALHIVVSKGSKSNEDNEDNRLMAAKMLLDAGANANAKTIKENQTPLHIATEHQYIEIIKLLLANNADINSRTKNGTTALHIGTEARNEELMNLLIENGAQVNHTNEEDNKDLLSPLHIACQLNNNAKYVKILLNHQAKVNCLAKGLTPLHVATQNHHANIETINLLLQCGADINVKNNSGQAPLNIAFNLQPKRYVRQAPTNFKYSDYDNYFDYEQAIDECEEYDLARYGNYYDYFMECKNDLICTLLYHAIALDVVKLYFNDIPSSREYNESIKSHREECTRETVQLKSVTFSTCKLNAYNILTMNIKSLAKYAKNEDIYKLLESNDFNEKFPIYSHIIQTNFRRATQRRSLTDEAHKFFKSCIFQLPFVCVEHVLSFLNCDDLNNVQESLKINN